MCATSSAFGSTLAIAADAVSTGPAAFTDTTVRAGEIGPGDPYYTVLHGGAPGWAPAATEEATA